VGAGDRPRPVGQLVRPQVVGRRVLEVAGAVGRVGHQARPPRRGPVSADHRQRGQRLRPLAAVTCAIAVEPVPAQGHPLDDCPGGRDGVQRRRLGDEGDRPRAHSQCRPGECARRRPDVVVAGVAADTDERHPAGPHAVAGRVQERHPVSGAAHLAVVDQARDSPAQRLVQRGQRTFHPRGFGDRDRQDVGGGAGRVGGRCGDAHGGGSLRSRVWFGSVRERTAPCRFGRPRGLGENAPTSPGPRRGGGAGLVLGTAQATCLGERRRGGIMPASSSLPEEVPTAIRSMPCLR
jgi:hypothetical protein